MSVINLSVAKSFLEVIHNGDDSKIQLLLDGAEDEARAFMNRADLVEWDSEVSSEPVPPSVQIGILLLLQAMYDATPDDAAKLRVAAEVKLMPYRIQMGV
ncbi:MAG: phage gp6-like head-tail connector protein [Pusillimonas sp.]|nr:phage gp6-like head-tail connector protein [Pusillimonas sp.]